MVLGYSVKGDSKVKKFLCDFLGGELAPLRGMPFSRAMAKLDDKRPGLAKAASKIMMAGRLMKR